MTTEYSITATEPSRDRISRHGISKSLGGQFVAKDVYQWPDTPVYMALEMMKEQYPNCDLSVTIKN